MTINKLEDFIAWQKARMLAFKVYKSFELNKDFGFKDQIQRAAVSIMNNCAEGFGRKSQLEFRNFLNIAKGSCYEVKSMLYLAEDLNYLSKVEAKELFELCEEVSKMLTKMITYISNN